MKSFSPQGHVKVVAILLECGAAVDARNAQLWTPLDCAASRGWTWCAERLLDADSIVDPIDKAKVGNFSSRRGVADVILENEIILYVLMKINCFCRKKFNLRLDSCLSFG